MQCCPELTARLKDSEQNREKTQVSTKQKKASSLPRKQEEKSMDASKDLKAKAASESPMTTGKLSITSAGEPPKAQREGIPCGPCDSDSDEDESDEDDEYDGFDGEVVYHGEFAA